MDPLKRKSLTTELQGLVAEIAVDLHAQLRAEGPARARARVIHRDERVGDDFDVWLDLLSRRAAVLWILKTVYVRVLEDRGFVKPVRLRDRESQVLFQHLAPGLGDTAYLRWVFKDLASSGGLPELFAPQPAEVASPSNDFSKKLLEFWRRTDETTQELRYQFDDEHFDGRLMGDLYQDLDPVVKERYALLQTPEKVVEYVLDHTLEPAMKEFGPEVVRVLDPACGSGHFLLAAFKRLTTACKAKHPERSHSDIVRDVLSRVVGIDLNDYACGLARARLVMTALELNGDLLLSRGGSLHPCVFWADGLEQVEREEQLLISAVSDLTPRSALTRPEVRTLLRPLLQAKFHVVVANPPYITEKDAARKEYHREKVGGTRRYTSATGKYSLGNLFTERMFQLALDGGFVGDFNANSFMKRDFGRSLIEEVLPRHDLFKVLDLAGARFDDYGTPTVLLLARRRAPSESKVLVVKGKVADPPESPGQVWNSASLHHGDIGYEDAYVSVGLTDRAVLAKHPWSLGGGGASELRDRLEEEAPRRLQHVRERIGVDAITRASDLLELPAKTYRRLGVEERTITEYVVGDCIREWGIDSPYTIAAPYDRQAWTTLPLDDLSGLKRFLWPHKTWLASRFVSGGTRMCDVGLPYWAIPQLPADKHVAPLSIAVAFVATHNEFGLHRNASNALFKQSAPIIKLPIGTSEEEHLMLLGVLNSSVACFWMKQVCHCKGGGGVGGGVAAERWEQFYEFSAAALDPLPIPGALSAMVTSYARRLDLLASERRLDSVRKAIDSSAQNGTKALGEALLARRMRDEGRIAEMVAVQEELDWCCYGLYGLDSNAPTEELRDAGAVEPLIPGSRAFEVAMARQAPPSTREDGSASSSISWFVRHGWSPRSDLAHLSPSNRDVIEARIARTGSSTELQLLEQPLYKRRWFRPDYLSIEAKALKEWLAERLEKWAILRARPFTIGAAAAAFQATPEVLSVVEHLAGRPDFTIEGNWAELVAASSVPLQKHHLFRPAGLTKRAVWERVWARQRSSGASGLSSQDERGSVIPKYAKGDYVRDSYWTLRGTLDVPMERFLALTEAPAQAFPDPLFVWTGLSDRARAKMLLELDEEAEQAGVAREDRIGLLYGIQFLADYVAWESEAAANEYRAAVTAVVGVAGVTEEMLADWAARHPPPQLRRSKAKTKAKKGKSDEESDKS